MATFSWAYVDCENNAGSGSEGPPHSIQFVTESGGATTGSAYLTYFTGSHSGLGSPGHTLHLTGTLRVKGAISASSYHIEDITQIGATGSTNFGNTNDDVHVRTGSLTIGKVGYTATNYIFSAAAHDESVRVRGFGAGYKQVNDATYIVQSADYILGIIKANTPVVKLPKPSGSNTGRMLIIKDEMPNRGTGSVFVTGSASGFKIDNSSSFSMSGSHPAISLYSNGTNWYVF